MATTPTLAELIRRALEARLADLHVSMPGRVEKYDAVRQVADVLPLVKLADVDGDGEKVLTEFPVIPNVRVWFPRGGGYSITWPLSKGDVVQLVFDERSTGLWRSTGDVADPGDLGLHTLSYPVAMPGGGAHKDAIPEAAINALIIQGDDIRLGTGILPGEAVALANLVEAQLQRLYDAIDGATPVANDGGAALKTAILTALDTPPQWPESVGASKVTAK